MTCNRPIDTAILADYWVGVLDGPEEEAVEQHLLECDDCGSRLGELAAVVEGVRAVAADGVLRMIVDDGFIRRLGADGRRIRQYTVAPGVPVQCTVGAEDDVTVARFAADLSNAGSVDLCFSVGGVEMARLRDIPFNPSTSQVVYQEAIHFIKAAPSHTLLARLVAVDAAGHERLLGEYTFHHTRTLPGPGAW